MEKEVIDRICSEVYHKLENEKIKRDEFDKKLFKEFGIHFLIAIAIIILFATLNINNWIIPTLLIIVLISLIYRVVRLISKELPKPWKEIDWVKFRLTRTIQRLNEYLNNQVKNDKYIRAAILNLNNIGFSLAGGTTTNLKLNRGLESDIPISKFFIRLSYLLKKHTSPMIKSRDEGRIKEVLEYLQRVVYYINKEDFKIGNDYLYNLLDKYGFIKERFTTRLSAVWNQYSSKQRAYIYISTAVILVTIIFVTLRVKEIISNDTLAAYFTGDLIPLLWSLYIMFMFLKKIFSTKKIKDNEFVLKVPELKK